MLSQVFDLFLDLTGGLGLDPNHRVVHLSGGPRESRCLCLDPPVPSRFLPVLLDGQAGLDGGGHTQTPGLP